MTIPEEVLSFMKTVWPAPGPGPGSIRSTPLGNGLINQTFLLTANGRQRLVLQCVNTSVFPDPVAIAANYDLVLSHARDRLFLPEPVRHGPDQTLYRDTGGLYWRAFKYVEGSTTRDTPQNAAQAGAVADCFAQFTKTLHTLDPKELRVIIPRFHDLSLRYEQFESACRSASEERMRTARECIRQLTERIRYVSFYNTLAAGRFPVRIQHHDAKIANVLFRETDGSVICPVDLDTVMPGTILSDLGDMVRSMSVTRDEQHADEKDIRVQPDLYDAILEGYSATMGPLLEPEERTHRHCSGLLMTYMQSLRFLTDHLRGDTYYRTTYPLQNLARCRNQLALLTSLESYLLQRYGYRI
jgi:Ser/Thr protein kinase RdoA (MazF antagonist)